MNTELDTLLCQRYPKIFADRYANPPTSCMSRGFECGDVWFCLLDSLCVQLQVLSEQEGSIQIVATQVKEKFGGLRFRVRHATDEQKDLTRSIEHLSEHTCETCGEPGQIVVDGGCLVACCSAHTPAGAIARAAYLARYEASEGVSSLSSPG